MTTESIEAIDSFRRNNVALAEVLAPFAADAGYELPGVALCAVGR